MRIIGILTLFALGMLCPLWSQVDYAFNLPDKLEALDILSLEEGFIQVIASDGIYELQNGEFVKEKSFEGFHLTHPHQNYSSQDSLFFYPTTAQGLIAIRKDKKTCTPYNIKTDGLLYKSQSHFILADEQLFKYRDNKWQLLNSAKLHNSYSDITGDENITFISTFGNGIFLENNNDTFTNIKKENGLFDNFVSALYLSKNKILTAHAGAFSETSIATQKTKTFKIPTDEIVIEIEEDNHNTLWFLTPNALTQKTTYGFSSFEFDLLEKEELLSIEIIDNNVWILSTHKLYYISGLGIKKYNFENSLTDKSFYTIRHNPYYTDGKNVFKYDTMTTTWNRDPLKNAPLKALINKDNKNVALVFKNRILELDHDNAKLKRNLLFNSQEEIVNAISRNYLTTDKHIYRLDGNKISLVSNQINDFYNVIEGSKEDYVFAASGIYSLKDSLVKIVSQELSRTNTQEKHNSYLLALDSSHLIIYNTHLGELNKINLGSMHLNDFILTDTEIGVLSNQALIFLDKAELFDGKALVTRTIPLFESCNKAKIKELHDHQLKLTCNDLLIEMDISPNLNFTLPALVPVIKSNETIKFKTNNHWTKKINYTYLIKNDENPKSYWSSDNVLDISDTKVQSIIQAKMKDNLFGISIFSSQVKIPGTHVRGSKLTQFIFFASVLLTFLILWRLLTSNKAV